MSLAPAECVVYHAAECLISPSSSKKLCLRLLLVLLYVSRKLQHSNVQELGQLSQDGGLFWQISIPMAWHTPFKALLEAFVS